MKQMCGIRGGHALLKVSIWEDQISWLQTCFALHLTGDSGGTCSITTCDIRDNKGSGVLVRQGAEPVITGSSITSNGQYGLLLQVGHFID